MDQLSNSEAQTTDQILEVANIGSRTTKLLNRILWKLDVDKNTPAKLRIPLSEPLSRTARYTGMHISNIQKILAFGNAANINYENIDRQIIQNAIVNEYLNKNNIPTFTELFNVVHNKLPKYVDIEYCRTILIKLGYVFYKFPKKRPLYVMEKKSVIFERYKYLKSIIEYRKNYTPIFYIGIGSINMNNRFMNLERTIQTPESLIIEYIFFVASKQDIMYDRVLITTRDLIANIKEWLQNVVLNDLPENSVVVIEDSKLFCEKLINIPTFKSVKVDMVEWLEYNNVPCDIDMPKSELLDLVETCTDTTKNNTFSIDSLINTYNIKVLRLPHSINGLSIAALVIDYVNEEKLSEAQGRQNVLQILKEISREQITTFSATVEKEEIRILEEDLHVDNVLDNLVIKMKTINNSNHAVNEDDTVLPYYSDSD